MKSLIKWQVISFISRMSAMLLGVIQSFVIIRLLSVSEWGIVQLAVSIGGALGIYQHLGLASASTREISSAKNDEDVFKVFFVSTFIRYCVTLPIALGLFFLSGYIANTIYKNASLVLPLQIYAISLLFQGVQSILNSVISGTKRFKELFIYQAGIAFVSIFIYVPLVHFFRVDGYFYAFLVFNIVASIVLSYIAFKPLKGKMVFPSKKDSKILFKEIFSISIAIYLVKIIYTNWEKMGNNILGLFSPMETVAIYSFALLYAKKLMHISDSVTDVNLPVLSERYVNDMDDFKQMFSKNFDKIFSFIIISAAFASYWAPTISRFLVGGEKYDSAFALIPPIIMAFVFYSFTNIAKSSVLIPAKMTKGMILSFVLLIIGTGGLFGFLFKIIGLSALTSMAYGMVFGSAISFLYIVFVVDKKLKFQFFNIDHVALIVEGAAIGWLCTLDNFLIKALAFLPFAGLLIWSVFISGFVTKEDVNVILSKVPFLSKRLKKA